MSEEDLPADMTAEELKLHFKIKTVKEMIDSCYGTLNSLKSECPHKIVKFGNSARCCICGKNFGWWCEISPTKYCEYENTPETEYGEYCKYCGEPGERK